MLVHLCFAGHCWGSSLIASVFTRFSPAGQKMAIAMKAVHLWFFWPAWFPHGPFIKKRLRGLTYRSSRLYNPWSNPTLALVKCPEHIINVCGGSGGRQPPGESDHHWSVVGGLGGGKFLGNLTAIHPLRGSIRYGGSGGGSPPGNLTTKSIY